MKQILFLGAGAIGRGYLPWLFPENEYDFLFVESNKDIVKRMNDTGTSTSYMAKENKLLKKSYSIKRAFLPEEFDHNDYDNIAAVFVSVGPRSCVEAVKKIEGIKAPIILCENDPDLVKEIKKTTTIDNIYFGVPDVITSNTAPHDLLAKDPLTVITEDGVMFIDEGSNQFDLKGDFTFISKKELLYKQWTAKLYIHNTPHCIAAYMGALVGATYLHEAMEVPEVDKIVAGVMKEMLNSLKLNWDIPHDFLDWYAEKELSRFRNKLLFDPISRVAREPLRKLELHGRLLGAANICISQGFIPDNILIGIIASLYYKGPDDQDRHLEFMRDHIDHKHILTKILKLRDGEALEMILHQRMKHIDTIIKDIIDINNKRIEAN